MDKSLLISRAKDLINRNINTYKILVKHAIDNNGITVENFLEICNADGLDMKQKEINDKLIYSYDKKLTNFLKS